MSKKIILVQIIIIIFAFGVFTQSNAQNGRSAGGSIARPADEAKIEVNILEYELKETGLEYLQSLPMPELKFVFYSNNTELNELSADIKITAYNDFPEDVKTILKEHWKEAIKYFYNDKFNPSTDGQEASKRDMAWAVFCNNKTHNELQEQLIEAPNGKRNISQTEAMKLWGTLNKAAVKVVNKIESIKQK